MDLNVWELYKKGREHHDAVNMYKNCEKWHDFYNGEQWRGLEAGDEQLPVLNFIKPVGRYKIAMIAQNKIAIVYSPMNGETELAEACEQMSAYAETVWEKSKMDVKAWEVVKNAFITGDHYLYCYDARENNANSVAQDLRPKLKMRHINKSQLYMADEQNPEINEQEWIIIAERVPVAKVKRAAKRNGISDADIAKIASDEDTAPFVGEEKAKEVKSDDGKCTSILFMRRTAEGVEYCRAVEQVVYQPMQVIRGLSMYPVVGLRWETKVGDARGLSGVAQMLPNQIEVNKTAARRVLAVKRFSYPKMAYDMDSLATPDALEQIGASIALQNSRGVPISSIIQYLNPAPVSGDAQVLQNELISVTRELEGASSAVTGQIDPTKASGEAIKAARDQAAVPLNEQMAAYNQFVEDIALLWWNMWAAYDPGNGVAVYFDRKGERQAAVVRGLAGMEVDVKVDVSPIDPYSRISQEIALERLLQAQYITFEEYVYSLSDTSTVPKAKLKALLDQREQEAMEQAQAEAMQQMGGMADVMPQMQAGNLY